jgi:CarD family transcriptional regulator
VSGIKASVRAAMTTRGPSSSESPKRGTGKPSTAQTGRTAPAKSSLPRQAAVAERKPADTSRPTVKAAATNDADAAAAAPPASTPNEAALVSDLPDPALATDAEPAAVTAALPAETKAGLLLEEEDQPEPLPPRLPAKAETFAEGDHVVYPTHGVGKVDRIATEEIAGHKLELIHITFEENRMTLRVPVAKARSAGLRKLATRKMFDEALGVLKGRARVKRTMWSRRAQEYEAKINSGDPLAIAEVVRDLHRNAGQPDQSFSERQIYEAAMDRLAAELAALDQTDKNTAAVKLANFLKTV